MSDTQSRLDIRYGSNAMPAPQSWSPVIDSLLGHCSVRSYLPTPVSDDQLTAIIAAAQSASSSSNLQAWSVVAVRDPAARAALAECAGGQAHVRDAPLQLVWLADLARLEGLATSNERPSAALDYMEMFLVGVIDAALAAQNAAAAAESIGLGTVYIGGMRNKPEAVAELLNLPPRVVAVFGMCVGTPDPAKPAAVKPRPPQSVVMHHERYSLPAQAPGIEAYNAAMASFYEEQKMNVHGTWAIHSAKRIAGPETLSGRDHLVEALHKRGFELK
ncbi:NADPH-dependent oxidoreductase [Parazoarcus communis]|uniref:NADPH-dependent oxidoreductase n=1 Tax=Parazoarcus communis TaxID=41977 RepID=A0A2U8H3Q1_9RHOO|nr:nitroreductase family protein [Parazoarcus communis]AWI79836.1 NADPH-dependent oxidoreductase [Parazoarcus communis]